MYNRGIMRQKIGIAKVVNIRKLTSRANDFDYWQKQPYASRIASLEEIRAEYNKWRYHANQRFQRVYIIIKQK
jgi:hypothetical protein